MNRGLFQAQINDIERVLHRQGLFLERNYFPSYRESGPALFRGKTYREIWEICYREKFYDFILQDNSLLQFKADFTLGHFGYSYYEAPYPPLPYSDYLIHELGFLEEELVEIGDAFRRDYEISLATEGLKDAISPVRYDYDPSQYVEGRHPASHIHIGHNSNIRVATRKLLRPLSFLMFILRQCYPDAWINFLPLDNGFLLCRNVRDVLDNVDNAYWNMLDNWEMVLD